MGHNIDLQELMGLPSHIICPKCHKEIETDFDEYDIDCGTPFSDDDVMTLDIQCFECEHEIEYKVKIIKDSNFLEGFTEKK